MVAVVKSIGDGLPLLETTLSGVQTQQALQAHAEHGMEHLLLPPPSRHLPVQSQS